MGTGIKKDQQKKKDNSYQKRGYKSYSLCSNRSIVMFSTYTDLAGILSIFTRKLMYHFIGL